MYIRFSKWTEFFSLLFSIFGIEGLLKEWILLGENRSLLHHKCAHYVFTHKFGIQLIQNSFLSTLIYSSFFFLIRTWCPWSFYLLEWILQLGANVTVNKYYVMQQTGVEIGDNHMHEDNGQPPHHTTALIWEKPLHICH